MAITPLPTPPTRDMTESEFVAAANPFLGALPAFGTEANNLATEVNNNADQVQELAPGAIAAANYKGDYSAGTTYAVGESVTYLGAQFYAKTENTGVTPVDGANWLEIVQAFAFLACVQDEKPSGTAGGDSIVGWQTRDLNTTAFDPESRVSLSSNEFTSSIDCGITWIAPAHGIDETKTRLVRASDNTVIAYGGSATSAAINTTITVFGSARILKNVAYRLEQYAGSVRATDGLGRAASEGSAEIYTQVNFWR